MKKARAGENNRQPSKMCRRTVGSSPAEIRKRTAIEDNPYPLVEAAGKRGIKQLIIVFDDAPEQNKELKERGTSDAQRVCLRAVGEATEVRNKVRAAEFCSCRAIYPHSAPDKRACRSTSGICEPTVAKATGSESVHRLGAKKEGLPQGKSFFFWSKRRDSNPRSPVPETGAIPPSLRLDNRENSHPGACSQKRIR